MWRSAARKNHGAESCIKEAETQSREGPTELYYFGARYHDPATGRFAIRDTLFDALEHRARGVQMPRIISPL